MSKKSLLETNPFLKDPEKRQKIVETVVTSSSSIEGVHAAAERALYGRARTRRSAGFRVPSSSSKSRS
jgi:hypothetical protein